MVNRKNGCHKSNAMLQFGSKIPKLVKKQKRNTSKQIALHQQSKSQIPIRDRNGSTNSRHHIVNSEYSLAISDNASKSDLLFASDTLGGVPSISKMHDGIQKREEEVMSREEMSDHTFVSRIPQSYPPPPRMAMEDTTSTTSMSPIKFLEDKVVQVRKSKDNNNINFLPRPPIVKPDHLKKRFQHKGRSVVKCSPNTSGVSHQSPLKLPNLLPPVKSNRNIDIEQQHREPPVNRKRNIFPPVQGSRNYAYDERKPVRIRGKKQVLEVAAPEQIVSHNDRQLRREVYGKQVSEQSRTRLPQISEMGPVRPRGVKKADDRSRDTTNKLPSISAQINNHTKETLKSSRPKPVDRRSHDEDRLPSESQMNCAETVILKPSQRKMILPRIEEENDYKHFPSASPCPPSKPRNKKRYTRPNFNYSFHALSVNLASSEASIKSPDCHVPSQHVLGDETEESCVLASKMSEKQSINNMDQSDDIPKNQGEIPWFLKPLDHSQLLEFIKPFESKLAEKAKQNKTEDNTEANSAWFIDFNQL